MRSERSEFEENEQICCSQITHLPPVPGPRVGRARTTAAHEAPLDWRSPAEHEARLHPKRWTIARARSTNREEAQTAGPTWTDGVFLICRPPGYPPDCLFSSVACERRHGPLLPTSGNNLRAVELASASSHARARLRAHTRVGINRVQGVKLGQLVL